MSSGRVSDFCLRDIPTACSAEPRRSNGVRSATGSIRSRKIYSAEFCGCPVRRFTGAWRAACNIMTGARSIPRPVLSKQTTEAGRQSGAVHCDACGQKGGQFHSSNQQRTFRHESGSKPLKINQISILVDTKDRQGRDFNPRGLDPALRAESLDEPPLSCSPVVLTAASARPEPLRR